MDNQPSRNPADIADAIGLPATQPVLDANGFDPNDFEWRPVPRRPRADGWTPEVQQAFVAALARTGIVERACEEVGMSVRSAYTLRNAAGGEGFARAWAAVLTRAADRLLDVAFEQAIEGEEVPVYDQDGVRTGSKRRYNTRMAMFLLRAYHPDRFRHANRDTRAPDEPQPAPPASVGETLATLGPVVPPEPHRLSSPDRLDTMLAVAEVHARYPANEEEAYVRRSVEQPPRVHARALKRRRQRERREWSQQERAE